jgi:2-oxoisovalerate dehydrogenase E2 component (dihydrolipoyl transacylase)
VLNALQLNESDFEASQTSQSSQSQGTRPNNETAITQAQNKVQQQGVLSGTVLAGAQIAPMFENRVESIRGIRAAMAKQMMASVSTIPHFTVSDELCMDKLITLRQQLKPEFEQMGVKLSFMPFFIKALSLALQQYPIVNSRLNPEATELTYLSAHNIGLAVDSKIGLMVPNIKNVQHLSLLEIAKELNRIIVAAREGKLAKADLQDGSISISNIGAIGGITATPVINKPEVAIVALGKTQQLPRFDEHGNVHASNVLMVNWSGDHRVIDGATMVKFNNLWLDYLTHPERMLVHLR